MKKLQLLMLAMLSTAGIYAAKGNQNETVDQRLARQENRTIEEKIAYLQEKIDSGKNLETPEFRLILKAIEYRKAQENGHMNVEQFNKQMAKKEINFKEGLERLNKKFTHHEERFFNYCKTVSSPELERRMEQMKKHKHQFLTDAEVLRIIEKLKSHN